MPDGIKLSWTRKHELKWKDVKNVYICSLHFESACFTKKKLDFNIAVPVQHVSDNDNVVQVQNSGDHDYIEHPNRSESDIDNVVKVQNTSDLNYVQNKSSNDFDDMKKKYEADIEKLRQENLTLRKSLN